MRALPLLLLVLAAACREPTDIAVLDAPVQQPEPDAPPVHHTCITPAQRATETVAVSGKVVDFVTGEGIPGATVDITTAWDVTGGFPPDDCPLIATVVTGSDGVFGPLTIEAGSVVNPSFVVFLVHGADRARTASDTRTCFSQPCAVDHQIAAPSQTLANSWRTALAAGGMIDATSAGLVAFTYKEADGTLAGGVEPGIGDLTTRRFLHIGQEYRILADDRATVLPTTQRATTAAGLALISVAGETSPFIVGSSSTTTWNITGCLEEPGWIFLEDNAAP